MACGQTSYELRAILEKENDEIPVLKDGEEDSLIYIDRRYNELLQQDKKLNSSSTRKVTNSVSKPNDMNPMLSETTLYERLIKSLEERIQHLEGQLLSKDIFIDKLIDKNNVMFEKIINISSCGDKQSHESHVKTSYQTSHEISHNISAEPITCNFETPIIKPPEKNVNDNKKEAIKTDEIIAEKMKKQLSNVRNNLHTKYISSNPSKQIKNDFPSQNKKQNQEKNFVNVVVLGDSMMNGIESKGISSKNVKTLVRSFSGATSSDMIDFTKPFIDKKPDLLFLHYGTNDLTKGINNTIDNFEKVINIAKQKSPSTRIILSDVCLREDKPNIEGKRIALNKKIHQLAKELNVSVLNNDNIDSSCLSRKKLHLNRKGMAKIATNIKHRIVMFESH